MASLKLFSPAASPWLTPDAVAATLRALVGINSVNPAYGGPPGGEARVMEWVAGFLQDLGLGSTRDEVFPGRANLGVTLEGEDGSRTFLFETHADTVSIDGMTVDPLGGEIRGSRLWGRGSTDAKGQLTAMLHALAAVATSGRRPPHSIELVVAVDEEAGFGGAIELVRRLKARGAKPIAAVIGEPIELDVVIAHKGTHRWWIEIEGRAAHSAKPHLGINAIRRAAALVERIEGPYARELTRRSHPLLGSPTVNVSKIEGGTQVNLVPARARILLDRRTLPGETREAVEAEFEAIFEALRAADPEFRARQLPPILVDPSLETSPEEPIVRLACALSAERGRRGKPVGVPYGTDGSKIAQIGIPTIVVGPGSIDQAHTADEWIELAELEAGALYYRDLMMAGPGA